MTEPEVYPPFTFMIIGDPDGSVRSYHWGISGRPLIDLLKTIIGEYEEYEQGREELKKTVPLRYEEVA